MAIINTIDIFTPLVDDGYIQGQITACNVTNDIYAMGVIDIIGILVFEAFPPEMPHTIAVDLLKGFCDFSNQLNTYVIGGHTIMNPSPLLGGCAIGISHPAKITYSSGARPGDTLLLTKALGTQPAMAVYRLLRDPEISIEEFFPNNTHTELEQLSEQAIKSMTTSEKPVAEIIHEIPINAATDVTGFGLAGHALEMAEKSKVDILIEMLPLFSKVAEISKILGYSLETGHSSETAGGLLLSVPAEKLDTIESELKKRQIPAYHIGKVLPGSGKVQLSASLEILEVKAVEK